MTMLDNFQQNMVKGTYIGTIMAKKAPVATLANLQLHTTATVSRF